jgi:hypothetical protein
VDASRGKLISCIETIRFRGGDDADENLLVLCFVCHHRLQPCTTGCGRWAKKPNRLCRHCSMRRRLEELYPDLSWEEIKRRLR